MTILGKSSDLKRTNEGTIVQLRSAVHYTQSLV